MDFSSIGLKVPKILLPRPGTDMRRWAVIACDQYTSEPEYWQRVRELAADAPSTLELIFPEVYLEDEGEDQRIAAINAAMRRRLADGTLVEQPEGFVLLDRRTGEVPSRKGLIVALDLERYDYSVGSESLIRATEGTILDRLPPRIKVRREAAIELPHIMVLIDDPQQTVIEPLFEGEREPLYDFELMEDGGHLKGWRVADEASLRQVGAALEKLAEPQDFATRYGVEEQPVVLFAMGDGNHSFATAKAIWEQLKQEAADKAAIMAHPARWALVELVNLHDPGLEFEPIHRVLFGLDYDDLLKHAEAFYASRGECFRVVECGSAERVAQAEVEQRAGHHAIPFVAGGRSGVFVVENSCRHLVVATLQEFLDAYRAQQKSIRIDYIHGDAAVGSLGGQPGNAGFFLPALSKHDLFKTIILDGALPRKTFSMGEADEKRFYLECRKIKP